MIVDSANTANKQKGGLPVSHTVVVPFIILSAIICFLITAILLAHDNNTTESNIKSIIEQTLLDTENSFLNVDSPHKSALVTAIIDNSTITVKEDWSDHKVVEICVPNFASALEKNFPALFTYSNSSYVESRLNSLSKQEYIDAIYSGILPEFVSPTVFYRVAVAVSMKQENNKWEIENLSELENHFLGNILSYQNNDVNFLTFRDLIFPADAGVQTSAVEAAALFQDISPASSYSSPETLVPVGDAARFSGVIAIENSSSKVNIDLTLSDVQINDNGTMTAFFKASTAEPDTEATIPSDLFGIYVNGCFKSGLAQDYISVTSNACPFQVSFETAADFIVFSPDSSPIYFAAHTE